MSFASVYPHYVTKVEKKGRTKEELQQVIEWLTGYDEQTLQQQIDKKVDYAAQGLGACVDCGLCVQVCPTGIDIRKGLQYECIGCAACVDVCDDVMKKMGYEPGLVRYDTQNGLALKLTPAQRLRRVLRPRVVIYTAVLFIILAAFFGSLALRSPFRVDVVRDRATLAREVEDGQVENVYRLQIMNATESTQAIRITADGLPGLRLVNGSETQLAPTEARWVAVTLRVPHEALAQAGAGAHEIHFSVERVPAGGESAAVVREKSTFMLPR